MCECKKQCFFCFDMSTKLRAVDDRLQRRSGLFFECPLKMLHFCSWQRTAAHWIVRLSPPLWRSHQVGLRQAVLVMFTSLNVPNSCNVTRSLDI